MILRYCFLLCLPSNIIFPVGATGKNPDYVLAPVRGSATLPCPTRPESEEDDLLLVLWYRAGEASDSSPIYSYDARSKNGVAKRWSNEKVFGKRAYFLTTAESAGLLIANLSPKDEGVYICKTDFRKSPTKHWKIILEVLIPPGTPRVFDGGGRLVDSIAGPYLEGSVVTFNCSSEGGKPPPDVSWYYNDTLIYSSQYGGNVGNTVKIKLMKRDDGAMLSCTTQNSNLTEAARKSFKVDLLLPPTSTKILKTGQPLSASREYEFVCQSAGSKPPAVVTWWKDEEQLFSAMQTERNGIVTSRLVFTPEADDDGRSLECRATNMSMEDESLEDVIELNVFFAPLLNVVLQQTNMELREEMDVQLECQCRSNPEVSAIEWSKDGEKVVSDSDRVSALKSVLLFRNISRIDSGLYACSGRNQEGVSTSLPYNLQVIHPPYCNSSIPKVFKYKTLSPIALECEVKANPLPLSFTWIRNSSGKILQQLSQDGSTSKVSVNSVDFGYVETVLCFSRNEVGKQRDPCGYHLVYEGSPGKPHNCSLTQPYQSVYILTCLPPSRHEPHYYLLQVYDLDVNVVTTNVTSSQPVFTLVVKEPTGFVISDIRLQNIVMLSRKRTMCRLFSVNQFGMSESVDTFINEEGAAHLRQDDVGSDLVTQALVISCICICAALVIGIFVLLLVKKFFKSKKRRRVNGADEDQETPRLSIPLQTCSSPAKVMCKYVLPSETEL